MNDTDSANPPPMKAVRLLFEYEGTEVRLVARQPVEMAVTGFDIAREAMTGHFVEVRDGEDAMLARLPARGAFADSAEVFPEQPGDPITRVAVEPKGAFTVVVPVPEEADHVSVVTLRPGPEGVAAALGAALGEAEVVELARFPLEAGTEDADDHR